MLSDEGNKFAQDYFDFDRDHYEEYYGELLCKDLPSMYHLVDCSKSFRTNSKFTICHL